MTQPYGYLHVIQAIHGDALMLEYGLGTGQDKTEFMLIDGGPAQTYTRTNIKGTTENVFELLDHLSDNNRLVDGKIRALNFIDTVVVTHDDSDHKNGIADLFRYLIKTKSPNVVWNKGTNLMTQGEAPIKKIWYNSQATLITEYMKKNTLTKEQTEEWLETSGSPKEGWFDTLLKEYNQQLSLINNNHSNIAFNEEFEGVLINADTHAKRTKRDVLRGLFAIRFKGPHYDKHLLVPSLVKQLIGASKSENARGVGGNARTAPAGNIGPGSMSKPPSADDSAKNKSSIAFLAIFQRNSGPGAHTRLLMLGDAMLTSDILAGNYTIIKIAHHGSGHNNYLGKRTAVMNSVNIKVAEGVAKQAFAFFYQVKAEKFVISASGKEGSPNPHISTILGILLSVAENRCKNPGTPSVDIYLTNELHPEALKVLGSFVKDPAEARDSRGIYILEHEGRNNRTSQNILHFLKISKLETFVKLWLLKPDISYGSIPIFDPQLTDHWIPFHEDALFQKTTPRGVGTPAANVNAIASASGFCPPKKRRK